jgi:hypothetical protein
MVAPAHVEDDIGGERLAGLFHLAVAGEDQTGHHQRLRPRARFGQAAVHQHLIGTLFRHPPAIAARPPGPQAARRFRFVSRRPPFASIAAMQDCPWI